MNDRRKYFTINIHESMGPGRIKFITPESAIRLATNWALWPDIFICFGYQKELLQQDHLIKNPHFYAENFDLTVSLLVTFVAYSCLAITFANIFDTDQAQQHVGSAIDPSC